MENLHGDLVSPRRSDGQAIEDLWPLELLLQLPTLSGVAVSLLAKDTGCPLFLDDQKEGQVAWPSCSVQSPADGTPLPLFTCVSPASSFCLISFIDCIDQTG